MKGVGGEPVHSTARKYVPPTPRNRPPLMANVTKISAVCEAAIARDANLLVPWYLMASYAYYVLDEPILTDALYDTVCFLLAEAMDAVEIDHHHAELCDPEALAAGTGYHIGEYPLRVVGAARRFVSGEFPA